MAPVRRRPEPFFYAACARGVTTLLQSVFLAFRRTFPARQSGLGAQSPISTATVIFTATGDQPHPVAITLHAKPVAVVFHFVQPVLAVRNGDRSGGEAEVKGSKHVTKIGVGGGFCEPTLCGWVARTTPFSPRSARRKGSMKGEIEQLKFNRRR
jgi:hypothetical protein